MRHLACLGLLVVAAVLGQEVRVRDGAIEVREGSLRTVVQAEKGPSWVGYAVDGRGGECWDGGCCRGVVRLEPAGRVAVLYRVVEGKVEKVRVTSVDCEIDAGGLKVLWLNGVKGEESVRWLGEMAELRGAVPALGMHRGGGEVETLAGLARKHAVSRVRGDALFWLAQRAGEKAVGTITEAIDQDPDTDVKKRAVFALSQLPKDESVRLLIQVARSNRNPVVRKQAFFWLGQSREPAALDFLEEILGTRGKGNAY
jgi:hypothetical protein